MTKENSVDSVQGWFEGRLPEGWFSGVEVAFDGDQVVVVGKLTDKLPDESASAEKKAGWAAGRISRFRGATRRERIWIAREAEAKFERPVTWGASLGDARETFNPGRLRTEQSSEQKAQPTQF